LPGQPLLDRAVEGEERSPVWEKGEIDHAAHHQWEEKKGSYQD
jgi:hypothetical protein